MKILGLAFIMALMVAMIGADSSSSEERRRFNRNGYYGGYNNPYPYPYPYQPYPQPYPYPYPY